MSADQRAGGRSVLSFLRESRRLGAVAMSLVVLCVGALAYPCGRSLHNMVYATLGRDPGIYQFVAWAMAHGSKPYVDIRENNGPLIYVFHALYLAVGGEDERIVRLADIVVHASAFVLAGIVAYGPWRGRGGSRRGAALGRLAFAALGLSVLFCQYFIYDWWATCQRESTYDAVLVSGLALQLRGHQRLAGAGAEPPSPRTLLLFLVSGLLVGATWFGKPTYVMCSAGQVACVYLDPVVRRVARRAVRSLAMGTLASCVIFISFIAIRGDVSRFVRIVLMEAPQYYVPIWRQTLAGCYSLGHNGPLVNRGAVTLLVMAALIAVKFLPPSFLLVLIPTAFGLVTFFAQRKGFLYHLHPVTAGAHLAWVMFLGWAYDSLREARRARLVVAFATVLAIVTVQCLGDATMTDYYQATWMPAGAHTEARETPAFYHSFYARDFDGWEVRRAAAFLAEHTPENGTVQTYGIEPYALFLAKRRTATPYIYQYDLNMDPALAGGPGGRPTASEAAQISQLQRRNADDLAALLQASPPSAFLLIDSAPMAYAPDALVDFRAHCTKAAAFMDREYEEAARFGTMRIFLPRVR